MNTTPIGSISTRKALKAPVAVAARPFSPRNATINESPRPITTWVEREMTTGQARTSSERSEMAGTLAGPVSVTVGAHSARELGGWHGRNVARWFGHASIPLRGHRRRRRYRRVQAQADG